MTWAYLILIGFDFLAMVATLIPLWRMAPWVRTRGVGRIVFFALLSVKLWVALVLGWFTVVLAAPGWPLRAVRDLVYLVLIVYIGVQAVCVSVALARWRRRGEVARRQGGIPD